MSSLSEGPLHSPDRGCSVPSGALLSAGAGAEAGEVEAGTEIALVHRAEGRGSSPTAPGNTYLLNKVR